MSADPLGIHSAGAADPNLYAYVTGMVLSSTDPMGLCDPEKSSGCEATASVEGGGVQFGGGYDSSPTVVNSNQGGSSPSAAMTEPPGLAHLKANSPNASQSPALGANSLAATTLGGSAVASVVIGGAVAATPAVGTAVFEAQAAFATAHPVATEVSLSLSSALSENVYVGSGVGAAATAGVAKYGDEAVDAVESTLEVRLPTVAEGLEVADALAWERQAVEALKKGGYATKPAIVIGRFDPSESEAGAFASSAAGHAEDAAAEAMPNGFFSSPISVRGATYADVCPVCEVKYGRESFAPGTTFVTDRKQ